MNLDGLKLSVFFCDSSCILHNMAGIDLFSYLFSLQAQKSCEHCNHVFGDYYCDICHLFDKDKKQYHCDGCGICRYVCRFIFSIAIINYYVNLEE